MTDHSVTQLLHQWSSGDQQALERLTPVVYDELRQLAARIFYRESAGHTLQPTALVNEAFHHLVGMNVNVEDRGHFFALSARLMRRILVDYARTRNAQKRGGDAVRVTFNEERDAGTDSSTDVLALDMAISELNEFDSRKAEILELHYFAGLTYREVSEVMSLSESTVHKELRTAKAWLKRKLS